MLRAVIGLLGFLYAFSAVAADPPTAAPREAAPRAVDSRLRIQLFAEAPQIVTPTGIDVDAQGRVWVIESNTHFPAADYKGHPTDRILVMQDTDGDGRADEIKTFADGFKHAMSIAVRPDTNGVFLATRRDVFRLEDKDGREDTRARKRILQLDTPGDYPHNGLAGFAFDATGHMYIGLGENLGAPYKLIGADGVTLSGQGEGGSIYRCKVDGTGLVRVATGFWNPHASCIDAFGRLFSVDNDPDSRPPCRLLHVVDGGDYGYRFRNGRRGIHPFTAWDGELPGTLPMVAGTGEAPSGIVAYESDGLPEDFTGNLLVTSWGDHRIDRFRLKQKGSSFTSVAEPLITGGENFRPVGLAVAPDGSMFCSDWVRKDYNVHGQGRVWRISAINAPKRAEFRKELFTKLPADKVLDLLNSRRIDVRRAAARKLASTELEEEFLRHAVGDKSLSARARIEVLWALIFQAQSRIIPGSRGALYVAEPREPRAAEFNFETLPSLAYSDDEVATEYVCQSKSRFSWGYFFSLEKFNANATEKELLLVKEQQKKRITQPGGDIVSLLRKRDSRDGLFPFSILQPMVYETIVSRPAVVAELFEIDDPFVFRETIRLASMLDTPAELLDLMQPKMTPSARVRIGLLLAARNHERNGIVQPVLEAALKDPDPLVRRTAVQWVGEEGIAELRPQLEATLSLGNSSAELMEAVIASMELLDGAKRDGKEEDSGATYVLKILKDPNRAPALKSVALRMFPAENPGFESDLVAQLLASNDDTLRTETVRALSLSKLINRGDLLTNIARDESAPVGIRADAIAGLAGSVSKPEEAGPVIETVSRLLQTAEPAVRTECIRVLRSFASTSESARSAVARAAGDFVKKSAVGAGEIRQQTADELATTLRKGGTEPAANLVAATKPRPNNVDEWLAVGVSGGDPEAGRRAFFRSGGSGCARCHRIEGRGGNIGPDLSSIARTQNRRKIVESILTPSKDIAPQFTNWLMVTSSGQSHTGFIIGDERNGKLTLGTSEGVTVQVPVAEIEERKPQNVSVMPEKLIDQLSVSEFQDIVTYLMTLR